MCSYSGYWIEDTCGLTFSGTKIYLTFVSKLFIYLLICSFVCMYLLPLFVYLFD